MNNLQPIPQNPISECHVWRDWFNSIRTITVNGTGSGSPGNGGGIVILGSSVAGGSNVNLTTIQSSSVVLEFTGVLTANIIITVPDATGQWTVYNGTTGPFTLTFKGTNGTGLVLEQSFRGIFYYNGTDMYRSNDPAVG